MKRISSKDSLDALRALPLFSALPEAEFSDLMSRCVRQRRAPGEEIFSSGDAADRFFVILSGTVKVFQLSAKGDEQILHLYGPGQTFAEAAVWAGGAYPAHAEAVTDGRLLAVPRRAVEQALEADPKLALGMLLGMSRKLQQFAALIDDLSLKEVPARLAGVLLAEAETAGAFTFDLTQTKRQLAAQIAAAPETLSRVLKKLTDDGLIEVTGKQIALLDLPALQKLYHGAG